MDRVGWKRIKNVFLADDDGLNGVIVGQHGDGDFSVGSGFARSVGDARAQRFKFVGAIFGAVVNRERVSGFDKLVAMPEPMLPRPMNAMFMDLLMRVGGRGIQD